MGPVIHYWLLTDAYSLLTCLMSCMIPLASAWALNKEKLQQKLKKIDTQYRHMHLINKLFAHLKDMYCTDNLTLTIFLSISIFLAPDSTLWPMVPATQ